MSRLCLHHALGNARAQPRHGHALLGPAAAQARLRRHRRGGLPRRRRSGGHRGECRRRRGSPRRVLRREIVHHIRFRHAPVAAGADQRLRIELVLLGDAPRGRAQFAARLRPRGAGDGRAHRVLGRSGGAVGRGHDGGRAGTRHGGCLLDERQKLAAGHRGAVLELDLRDHARHGCRNLEHDLVRLEIDQILIARHRIARLFVPRDQGSVGHRLG